MDQKLNNEIDNSAHLGFEDTLVIDYNILTAVSERPLRMSIDCTSAPGPSLTTDALSINEQISTNEFESCNLVGNPNQCQIMSTNQTSDGSLSLTSGNEVIKMNGEAVSVISQGGRNEAFTLRNDMKEEADRSETAVFNNLKEEITVLRSEESLSCNVNDSASHSGSKDRFSDKNEEDISLNEKYVIENTEKPFANNGNHVHGRLLCDSSVNNSTVCLGSDNDNISEISPTSPGEIVATERLESVKIDKLTSTNLEALDILSEMIDHAVSKAADRSLNSVDLLNGDLKEMPVEATADETTVAAEDCTAQNVERVFHSPTEPPLKIYREILNVSNAAPSGGKEVVELASNNDGNAGKISDVASFPIFKEEAFAASIIEEIFLNAINLNGSEDSERSTIRENELEDPSQFLVVPGNNRTSDSDPIVNSFEIESTNLKFRSTDRNCNDPMSMERNVEKNGNICLKADSENTVSNSEETTDILLPATDDSCGTPSKNNVKIDSNKNSIHLDNELKDLLIDGVNRDVLKCSQSVELGMEKSVQKTRSEDFSPDPIDNSSLKNNDVPSELSRAQLSSICFKEALSIVTQSSPSKMSQELSTDDEKGIEESQLHKYERLGDKSANQPFFIKDSSSIIQADNAAERPIAVKGHESCLPELSDKLPCLNKTPSTTQSELCKDNLEEAKDSFEKKLCDDFTVKTNAEAVVKLSSDGGKFYEQSDDLNSLKPSLEALEKTTPDVPVVAKVTFENPQSKFIVHSGELIQGNTNQKTLQSTNAIVENSTEISEERANSCIIENDLKESSNNGGGKMESESTVSAQPQSIELSEENLELQFPRSHDENLITEAGMIADLNLDEVLLEGTSGTNINELEGLIDLESPLEKTDYFKENDFADSQVHKVVSSNPKFQDASTAANILSKKPVIVHDTPVVGGDCRQTSKGNSSERVFSHVVDQKLKCTNMLKTEEANLETSLRGDGITEGREESTSGYDIAEEMGFICALKKNIDGLSVVSSSESTCLTPAAKDVESISDIEEEDLLRNASQDSVDGGVTALMDEQIQTTDKNVADDDKEKIGSLKPDESSILVPKEIIDSVVVEESERKRESYDVALSIVNDIIKNVVGVDEKNPLKRRRNYEDDGNIVRKSQRTNENIDALKCLTEKDSSNNASQLSPEVEDLLLSGIDKEKGPENTLISEILEEIILKIVTDKEIIVKDIINEIIVSAIKSVDKENDGMPTEITFPCVAQTTTIPPEENVNKSTIPVVEKKSRRCSVMLSNIKVEVVEAVSKIKVEPLELCSESEGGDLNPDVLYPDILSLKRSRRSQCRKQSANQLTPAKRSSPRKTHIVGPKAKKTVPPVRKTLSTSPGKKSMPVAPTKKNVPGSPMKRKAPVSPSKKGGSVGWKEVKNIRKSTVVVKKLQLPKTSPSSPVKKKVSPVKPIVPCLSKRHSPISNIISRTRSRGLNQSLLSTTSKGKSALPVTRKRSQTAPAPSVVPAKRRRSQIASSPALEKIVVNTTLRRGVYRNVAVKSTGTRPPLQVAKKSTRPHLRGKGFTGVVHHGGIQLVDESDSALLPRSGLRKRRHSSPCSRPSKKRCGIIIRTCFVKVIRMPVIDRLLLTRSMKSEPNICEFCEPKRVFVSKEGFAKHFEEEHVSTVGTTAKSDQVHRCAGCDRKYNNEHRLVEHMRTCPAVAALPSSSKESIVSLVNRGLNIKKAKKQVGEKELSLSCSVCGKKFSLQTALQIHMKIHQNQDKDPLNVEGGCDPPSPGAAPVKKEAPEQSVHFASQMIRRSGKLILRLRRERATFRCKKCSAMFFTKGLLSEHTALHKTGYFCRICSEIFQRKDQLSRHEAIHRTQLKREKSPEVEILEEHLIPSRIASRPTKKMTARKSTAARPFTVTRRKASAPPTTSLPSTRSTRRKV